MNRSSAETAGVLDGLRALHIGTPSCRALNAQLSRLFPVGGDGTLTHEPVRFTGGTETHGIIRIGGAGDGKTSSMLHVVRTCGAFAENPETGTPRFIHVTVASPATLRSLACQFLEKLGIDKVSDRAKVHELWTLVRRRLQVLGVSLVVVDEAHDMFRSTSTGEFGAPELLVADHDPAFMAIEFTDACNDLGITLERTIAGRPAMRGSLERFFKTCATNLVAHLSGGSFSKVIEPGAHPTEERACPGSEDLSHVLGRWIVDIYNNTPHSGLGGLTPLQQWEREHADPARLNGGEVRPAQRRAAATTPDPL